MGIKIDELHFFSSGYLPNVSTVDPMQGIEK